VVSLWDTETCRLLYEVSYEEFFPNFSVLNVVIPNSSTFPEIYFIVRKGLEDDCRIVMFDTNKKKIRRRIASVKYHRQNISLVTIRDPLALGMDKDINTDILLTSNKRFFFSMHHIYFSPPDIKRSSSCNTLIYLFLCFYYLENYIFGQREEKF
jgi:hypothetical protein